LPSPTVPVTVISGFVGAGKTTLLDRLLADTEGARVGVVASDPSAAGFARARGAAVRLARPRLVEMHGGRLCCSLREDVRQELCGLAAAGGFERLLVASDGLAEPLPVAQTLVARGDDGKRLLPGLRLDALVTVVDARALLDECDRDDTLRERGLATHPRDDRRVLEVIVDQVEAADVLVLAKVDLVTDEEKDLLLSLLARLNPTARRVESVRGRVPSSALLDTGLFDERAAGHAAAWARDLRRIEDGGPGGDAAFRGFVYRARRPFHPARFHRFLFEEWDGVLRSRGFFWLATRPDLAGYWSHTGSACGAQAFSPWWAATPASLWPTEEAGLARIESTWDERLGDRRQELVFIGRGMDEGGLRHGLDRCLLSEAELSLGASGWAGFHDPFPSWTGRVPAEAPDRAPRCLQ
jgi:G3E family GTPase